MYNINNMSFKPTLKIDLDTPEELNDPFIVLNAINRYKGVLPEGEYRFLVVGKLTEQIYLDSTLPLKYDFYQRNKNNLTASKFWTTNRFNLGFIDSNESVFNEDEILEPKILLITKQLQIDPDFFTQRFLEADIGHCVFNPILKYFESNKHKKSSIYKSNYYKIINWNQKSGKVKTGLIEQYKNGVSEDEILDVCNKLKIGIDISQPLNENFISVRPDKGRCHKVFKYINTRNNHIDESQQNWNTIFNDNDPIILTPEEMTKKYVELTEKKEPFIYSTNKDIIKTPLNNYTSNINGGYRLFQDFEKDQGLDKVKIYLDDERVKIFLQEATKYNSTVDFIETKQFKEKTTEYLLNQGVKHYDQTKAYTQFKESKYYNGFVGKITDFRKINHYRYKGFYRIINLDLSECNEKFKYYHKFLLIFENDGVYCDTELKFLEDQGAKFKVTHGLYGFKFDFDFTQDMLEKTTNPKHPTKKIYKYAYWTGMNGTIREQRKFYMNGEKSYFQNQNADLLYDEYHQRATFMTPKKNSFSLIHISAQILAYQRLNMLEQIMKLDEKKLIRICIDGFYTYEENPKLINKFRQKEDKLTFNNTASKIYSFSLNYDVVIKNILPKAKAREHFKTELWKGQGGNGKTHSNLIDGGFVNLRYIAPTHKLGSKKKEEYGIKNATLYQVTYGKDTQENYRFSNVLLIDEASMINKTDMEHIIKNYNGKIIVCGDINYQLKPIDGAPITENLFDNVIHKKINYRFLENDKIRKITNHIRKLIDRKITYLKTDEIIKITDYYNIEKITKEELTKRYTTDDIIMTFSNARKNLFTEKFKHLDKYYILERKKEHSRGDITTDKKLEVEKELRHGYTIHSIQGETINNKLYLDPYKVMSLRALYTALSRVRTINNIKIII